MGAARYIGRVGGLAVAVGAGVAILVGSGAASADTGDGDPGTSSSSSSRTLRERPAAAATATEAAPANATAATTEAVSQPAALQDTAATQRPAYDPKTTLKDRAITGTNEVPTDSLTLQIVDSATAHENFTSYGVINVTEVSVTLPTAAKDKVTPATLPPPPH